MRHQIPHTGALALFALLAACDDGRYLVGVLGQGQGPNQNMAGTGGVGGGGGAAGAGGMIPSMPPAPPPSACTQATTARPPRPIGITTAQVAERLARFIFVDRPGADLVMRAAVMRNSADVQQLTREMLADSRARPGVAALLRGWLRLDAIRTAPGASSIRGELSPELRASMQTEADRFVEHLYYEGDRRLHTLLTANYTFLDGPLASIYGMAPPPSPWIKVMLDPRQRSGVLTLPGLLFANPRATQRGFWLREQLLCHRIPPPPLGSSQPDLDVPSPTKGARQRLEESVAPPACKACHQVMDSPGFALEHFDPLGRWRDSDMGVPVDATGSLTSLPEGGAWMFDGAPELGAALAKDCSVQICAVRTFLERALGGPLRSGDDQSIGAIWADFARSGFDLRELIVAVTGSEAFLAP